MTSSYTNALGHPTNDHPGPRALLRSGITMRTRAAAIVTAIAAALASAPARAQPAADEDVLVEVPADDEYADTDPSPLTDFRPALDPYGTWTDDPTYGRVWAPSADQLGADFQPYETAGSWDYVDGDYVWVSDYAWGWICFHYGRWALGAGGWVWVPGRTYAGAWVSWRVGDDAMGYVGWAPMAPAWIWIGGAATALGVSAPEPWVFTPNRDLLSPDIGAHVITGNAATAAVTRTRPYVPAQPTVTKGPVSRFAPRGPPPAMLGLDMARLTTRVLSARELRARQLARPSTALALGVRAPSPHAVRATPRAGAVPREPPRARGTARGKR